MMIRITWIIWVILLIRVDGEETTMEIGSSFIQMEKWQRNTILIHGIGYQTVPDGIGSI